MIQTYEISWWNMRHMGVKIQFHALFVILSFVKIYLTTCRLGWHWRQRGYNFYIPIDMENLNICIMDVIIQCCVCSGMVCNRSVLWTMVFISRPLPLIERVLSRLNTFRRLSKMFRLDGKKLRYMKWMLHLNPGEVLMKSSSVPSLSHTWMVDCIWGTHFPSPSVR